MRQGALAMIVVQVHGVETGCTGPGSQPGSPIATADVMGAQEATPARAVWVGGWWWLMVRAWEAVERLRMGGLDNWVA